MVAGAAAREPQILWHTDGKGSTNHSACSGPQGTDSILQLNGFTEKRQGHFQA